MHIDLNQDDLKQGVLSLVMALVEVIRDTIQLQAIKRMEGENLTPEQIERLGVALMELNLAIESIKREHNIADDMKNVRDGLDDLAAQIVGGLADPVLGRKILRSARMNRGDDL